MKMVYALIALTSIGIHAADWTQKVPADDAEKKLMHSMLTKYTSKYAKSKKAGDSWDEETRHICGCEGGYPLDTEDGTKYVSRTVVSYSKDHDGSIHTTKATLHYTDYKNGTSAQTDIRSTVRIYVDGREEGAIEGRFPCDISRMPQSLKDRRAVKAAYWERVFAAQRHGNA
ncbi:MAG: hypothetical protein ACHQVS_02540 [Candidatus Babeliales bacterium]